MSSESELPADVLAAIRADRKIEAIKLLRQHRNLGLKEARDIIDAYIAGHPASTVNRPPRSDSGLARLLFAGVATAVIYAIYRYFS